MVVPLDWLEGNMDETVTKAFARLDELTLWMRMDFLQVQSSWLATSQARLKVAELADDGVFEENFEGVF